MSSTRELPLSTAPDTVLMKIMDYIDFDDILNLRLACRSFYDASNCNAFFERVRIKVQSLRKKNIHNFEQLLQKFGHLIKLDLGMIKEKKMKLVRPYIKHVNNFCINYKDVKYIYSFGYNITSLTIQFDFKTPITDQVLSYLSNLKNLKRFRVEVIRDDSDILFTNRLHYLPVYITHALGNLLAIEEFEFKDVYRSEKKKDCPLKLFQSPRWRRGVCLMVKHVIRLPASLVSFEWNTGANDFGFNTADSNNLQKLIVKRRYPFELFHSIQFQKLKYLQLNSCSLGDAENDFLDPKYGIIHCPNLEILKLRLTRNTLNFFKENSYVFKSSLQELSMQSIDDINDRDLVTILGQFDALKTLTLVRMDRITNLLLIGSMVGELVLEK